MPIHASSYSTPREDLGVALHEFAPEGQEFAADKILPELPVMKKAAVISVIKRENYKAIETDVANGGSYPRIGLEVGELEYSCKKRGLEAPVTDDDRENFASDFDADLETAQVVKTRLMIQRELRVKNLVFNTATWTGAALYTDVSAAPWDAATSDIPAHVIAAAEKVRSNTGVKANALLVGRKTLLNMLVNSKITGKFQDGDLTIARLRQAMPTIFDLEELIVGGVIYDGAKEGAVFSGTDIWGDDYAMVLRVQRGPTRTVPGLGRTMLWTRRGPHNLTLSDSVFTYREEQTESDIVRVKHYTDENIFDKYFAHLLKVDA
jgi:hypothetical protein